MEVRGRNVCLRLLACLLTELDVAEGFDHLDLRLEESGLIDHLELRARALCAIGGMRDDRVEPVEWRERMGGGQRRLSYKRCFAAAASACYLLIRELHDALLIGAGGATTTTSARAARR